jgi:hypothetical protein
MTIMPPPQGKHHRRHGTHAQHKGETYLSTSDIMWTLGVAAYFALMVGVAKLMDDGLWVMLGLTGVLVALFVRRLMHHPGDRHRNGLKTTPQEEQEFVARTTGEIPVLTPTALSSEPFAAQSAPAPAPQQVYKPRPWWMPTKGQLITFGLATFVMIVSEFSEHRAETAKMMQNDIDRLLGVPGDWNGYAPTTPTMGIRGWGSYGQQARQDTMPFTPPQDFLEKRQYAALHGYDQDRFSEAGREKWEGFFR